MVINTIIVEDSRLARKELIELLKVHPEINIIDEADNIKKAKILIETNRPELIFLDINMPGGDGFELLEKLSVCPIVIFTTAYDEYAVKAFEYNALDYLLKPINPKRLSQSIAKVRKQTSHDISLDTQKEANVSKQIFVKEGDKCWIVQHEKIKYFESCGNYVKIHFDKNKPMLYKSLNKIESTLDNKYFVRASRQFIVNKTFIVDTKCPNENCLTLVMDDERTIVVSRRNIPQIKKIITI